MQTRLIAKTSPEPGATYLGDSRCRFRVWAPYAQKVELHLISPEEHYVSLNRIEKDYFEAIVENVLPGALYLYRLDDGNECSDPASRYQPQGVLGPSQVTNSQFKWEDNNWSGILLPDYIIYELHVGTYTQEGTFEAIIPYLSQLKDLGITAIELMPIAQFPGHRNWGYDGVYPFAVQNSYGGVEGLKKLVNACHKKGLAVVLDVVYNHIGPEGSCLSKFGPYFTDKYRTTWGQAMNFDGPGSDEVRRFYRANALYWVTDFHIDALRLDAVHAILDFSPQTFMEELAMAVKDQAERLSRRIYLIAESDTDNARLIRSSELGGYGIDAQWNDDFHHALHYLLTGEDQGYYRDFTGLYYLTKAIQEGFAYSGEYSFYRGFSRGTSSRDIPAYRFVVFSQNHDHIGNRMLGERLSHLVSFESLKLAAAVVLLSPNIPLLFMGEEYAETAYFPYFVSHSDPKLVEAVRKGRREEFAAFLSAGGNPPDPQSERTFRSAKLDHQLKEDGNHHALFEFYRELIRLRKTIPALRDLSKDRLEVFGNEKQKLLFIRRWFEDTEILAGFNFCDRSATTILPIPTGLWKKRLDSSDRRWEGDGTSVPDEQNSDGELNLSLSSKGVLLLERCKDG